MGVAMETTIAAANTTDNSTQEFEPQALRGFMTNEEWDQLLARADYLVSSLEQIEDAQERSKFFELLNVLDQIHRESLTRLVRLFKDGVMEQVITDPPIRTLMDLYDLLPTASSCSGGDSQSVSLNTRKVARWIPSRHSAEKLSAGLLYSDQIEDAFIFLCLVEEKSMRFQPSAWSIMN